MGQYVDEFSKLARYAPDDVATDAAKQEKFLEGFNDELSMQLMVATFKQLPGAGRQGPHDRRQATAD